MKINIKTTNLELTPSLQDYIEKKIGLLERFLKSFKVRNEIEVFIEIAHTTKHHRKGFVYYAEATIPFGKSLLRAEHLDRDIRIAIDRLKEKLKQEIKKYKEKKIGKRREKTEE